MAPLNILIGSDSFRKLRENKCYYADKTSFLEEMLVVHPPVVSLITRPRRFGKTLMMSMMQEFFDINKDSRGLFEGLAVARNAGLCNEWMNKYPTLFLTLKGVEGRNYGFALGQMSDLLKRILIEHPYLLSSEKVDHADKDGMNLLKHGKGSENDMANALNLICRGLHTHHGKPVILLIDEYDVPVKYAEQNGYYEEMIGFMRSLLGSVLKTNPSLKFAVLTGCLRIAKESIFTGLNNFKCYGVSDALYADKFGFTSDDVDNILRDAGFSEKKPLIKKWYDGYRFGRKAEMYCPWDILQYVYDIQIDPAQEPQAYWNNTSSNDIVHKLIAQASADARQKVEDLIDGRAIEEKLTEDLTYDLVYENESSIWSMMYLTGYLTRAARQPGNDCTALVIPNEEVRRIFKSTVTLWFYETVKKRDLSLFVKALWNGDTVAIEKTLRQILYDTISYHDSQESFYHGFLTGLIRGAGLAIRSSREHGRGRTDITIEDGLNSCAIIIELNVAHAYNDLDKKADEALSQIEENHYADGLSPQIKTVCKYGMSFSKKECCVKLAK